MAKFTKKDLKNGDFVVRRDGKIGVVIVDRDLIVLDDGRYDYVSDYTDDLRLKPYKIIDGSSHDIIKVFRESSCFKTVGNILKRPNLRSRLNSNLVYDREQADVIEFMYKDQKWDIDLSGPIKIVYDSKGEAECVLNALKLVAKGFGYTSMADLMDLSPLWACNDYRCAKYGWTDLSEACIISLECCDHAMLRLPRPIVIKEETCDET